MWTEGGLIHDMIPSLHADFLRFGLITLKLQAIN